MVFSVLSWFCNLPCLSNCIFSVIVVQALDTLGNTKWRVNKKVLSIIDRIWASGGRIADLVDREDVCSFDKKFVFVKGGLLSILLMLLHCRFLYQRNQIRKIRLKLRNGNGKLKMSKKIMPKGILNVVIQNLS